MKLQYKTLALFFSLLISTVAFAQKKVVSPAETVTGKVNGATITIKYGSPSVKGRAIWGGLVPYDKVWRAGANDATIFETDKTITIEGKQLPAGKYSFFVIPNENESVIIFNKEAKQWGAYEYKASSDQLRVTVKNENGDAVVEKLEYKIMETRIELLWEKLIIGFEVK
nr:DUF2911 domain-containing protein [uncultured Flavobacterium sp.]